MRLVVDTNILVSALLTANSLPAHLLVIWREGRFDVLTSAEQLDELRRVTRYPKLRARLPPALAGRLVNDLRVLAITVTGLPVVTVSPDSDDNHLPALVVAGAAGALRLATSGACTRRHTQVVTRLLFCYGPRHRAFPASANSRSARTMSFLQRRPQPAGTTLSRDVADALDASADDLRHNRVEDAAAVLERVQAKVDAYKSRRGEAPGAAEKC